MADNLSPLTTSLLATLKKKGYRFVHIRPVGGDGHTDYIQPMAIFVHPVQSLPTGKDQAEVYESIECQLLEDWACSSTGVQVLVDFSGKSVGSLWQNEK